MAQSTVPAPVLDSRDDDLVAAQAIGALPSELSDRSDSNPAVVVLEAASWIYGKLAYVANRWPSGVIQKCLSLIGVTLNPATPATVSQTFTLSAPQPTDTVISAGAQVATTDGTILFSTLSDLTIAAYTAPSGTITLTSGSTAVSCSAHSLVTGTTWVGWQIGVQGANGAAPATWYTIASVTNDQNLVLSSPASSTSSGAFYVGPISGSVSAQATTTGSATNIGAAKLTSLQTSIASVSSTTNNAAATGGNDIETVTAAIARAPLAFATRDVACSTADYAEFARRTLGSGGRATAKANTNITTTTTGYVSVAMLSPTWSIANGPIATAERAAVVRDLVGRSFTGATIVDVAPTIYQPTPALAVYRKSSYSAAQVQANVAAAINTYLSPNTYSWGRVIYPTDLSAIAATAAGVDRVHEINGVVAASSNLVTAPAAITFGANAGPHATTSTNGFYANQTLIVDSTNSAVYLVVSVVTNTSITLDRAWAGTVGAQTPSYFNSKDDDMNSGNGALWYALPYSNLSTSTSSPPASIVVVGSV